MRLFEAYRGLRDRPVLGYGLALVAFAAGLTLRFQTDPFLPPGFPYITFFPAVIITAFIAGLGPSTLCAVLSGLAAWYFFIPPQRSLAFDYQVGVALAFYVFVVGIDIVLIEATQRTTDRLADARRLTGRLLDQQRTMFQELQHRVANNMTFVAAILHLERRRAAGPEAAAALDSAVSRVETMSRMHRRLYDPETAQGPIDAYLRDLAQDLVAVSGLDHVQIEVEADPVVLDISHLMTLSLLVTELVMNALKHAFPGRTAGRILIRLVRLDEDRLELEVRDDGCGFDTARETAGLGSRIARNLASQLGGGLDVRCEGGTIARVAFHDPGRNPVDAAVPN
jgi:two-component sensor histidine kinase